MKILISVLLILVPTASLAVTDCHIVEFPDHYEAVCTGDEKSVPDPAPQQSIVQSPLRMQITAPVNPGSGTPVATVATPSAGSAVTSPTPIQRQGRQQFQQAMKDAKEMRAKLIAEHQSNQPPPDFVLPPTIQE